MTSLRAVVPWIVGLAILAVVLHRVDLDATGAALARADLGTYLTWVLLYSALWLAIDSGVLAWLYGRADAGIGWCDIALERAATYPLMILSYHVASAALVARLGRYPSRGAARRTGALLAHYLCDLVALAGIAAVAAGFVELPGARLLQPLLLVLAAGAAGTLIAGRLGRGWLAGRPVVDVLADLSLTTLLGTVAGRALWYASFLAFVWQTGPLWGLSLPLAELAARMPIVLTVAALPIAPAGLGTTQAAMLALFAGLASPPDILAYALVYSGSLMGVRLPIGALALWLGRVRAASLGEART